MWAYIGVMLLGVAYAIWHGASFFRAMRQAQMQFSAVLSQGDTARYIEFVNQVSGSWAARLAAFTPDRETGLATVFFFVIGWAFFELVRPRPRGVPLGETQHLARERLDEAFRLAKNHLEVRIRTDGVDAAVRIGDTLYLPREGYQLLSRKFLKNAPRQIAFLILHEGAHYRTSDNLLHSLGRYLIFTTIAIIVLLLATPVFLAIVTALPNSVVQAVPASVVTAGAALLGGLVMGLFGTIISGLFANFTVMQELFADAYAASVIGTEALPYDGTHKAEHRGGLVAAWATTIPAPDRRLHLLGTTPRTGALAASAIAMWIVVRTLILIVHPAPLVGPVWIFDLACIGNIALLLSLLPHRARGARDYGVLPIIATLTLSLALPAMFLQVQSFSLEQGATPFISAPWMYALAIPPILGAAAGLTWHMLWVREQLGLSATDRLPPKRELIVKSVLLLAATPAYAASTIIGMLAIFTMAVTLTDWLVSQMTATDLIVSIVSFLLCAITALFVSKNIVAPSKLSILAEILWELLLLGAIVYTIGVMVAVTAASPPSNAGPIMDMSLFLESLQAMPSAIVSLTVVITTALGIVMLLSWIGRAFLIMPQRTTNRLEGRR